MPADESPNITARKAAALLDRDKGTVIRWARDGVLTIVDKLDGKNGAILLDRAQVLALAERLRREAANQRRRARRQAAS